MDSVTLKKVPDGGWGWVVVGAVALINMTNQSILSVFGLLFGSQLKLMGQATFTAALINNLNSCALNFSGLFIGPAIKHFKPRNVAATGCLMVSFGLAICAFATESWQFIVGYSFFVGFGLGLISPSTFVAINSYFSSKRGRAVGVSLAGAGIGQIALPHVVRVLLEVYGFRIAVLAMSLLSLIGLLGALLLKPLQSQTKHNNRKHMRLISESAESNKAPNGLAIKIVPSKAEDANDNDSEVVYKQTTVSNTDHEDNDSRSSKVSNKFCQRIVEAMDLELLTDPVFLSIIIGMALVYTSTVNFSMLFPHFLEYSVHVSKHNIATCMSIVAGADILCRLLLPCITDKLKVPYRVVFLMGTTGLLIARSALAEAAELPTIIVMSVFIGMAKSATVLNNNLTVSSHCRPEKLPGALGLNMMSKGVLVISIGQLLGWIRDYTNSYVLCLHAQNILLLLVVVVWTPEIYYRYWRKRSQAKRYAAASLAESNATAEEVTKMNPC